MKRTLTLFQKRPYEFVAERGKNKGQLVKGNMYGAFAPDGTAFEFSSTAEHQTYSVAGFDPAVAVEIDLMAVIFDGKVKYREATAPSASS